MTACEAEIDLSAIASNTAAIAGLRSVPVMAVVKADGYGHGLVPSARAALRGGARWLGVASADEARALRTAGIRAPVLCWLLAPGDVAAAIAADVDVSVSAPWMLAEAVSAARDLGRVARVHLKVDTGCGRGGAPQAEWAMLVKAVAAAVEVEVVGVWSHLALADVPGHPATARQLAAFDDALRVAEAHAVTPRLRHLAGSAAALTLPEADYDLLRVGIALYGVNPTAVELPVELAPAMTLRAKIALVKRAPAGTPVSYGHEYRTPRETTLALVAAGYADGVPRAAGGRGPVLVAGHRRTVSGRVCMDQFVVDVGELPVIEGDEVVLFGGEPGMPRVEEWAVAARTIPNEIFTGLGPRVRRVYRAPPGITE